MENIFGSIKEFVWDIIGYLIPGALVLVLLKIIFNLELKLDKDHFLFIILAYIIGYVIYGINIYIYEMCSPSSYRTRIEHGVKIRPEYEQCINKVNTKLGENFSTSSDIREIRSIIMSYIPESDTKIYTFTFRSELSNSCATVCFIFGIVGLICSLFSYILGSHIKSHMILSFEYIIFYFLLIICSTFLNISRDKFYRMSISLPFSIFRTKTI